MSRLVEVPKLEAGDLRAYVPALAYAVQAVRDREAGHAERFEPVGAKVARDSRLALEELLEIAEES